MNRKHPRPSSLLIALAMFSLLAGFSGGRPAPALALPTANPTASSTPASSSSPVPTQIPPLGSKPVAVLGKGYIKQTAVSPDGKIVAIGYSDAHVSWYDAASGKEIGNILIGDPFNPSEYFSNLRSIIFSQDSRLMLLATSGNFAIIDLSLNKEIANYETDLEYISDISISRNSHYIIFCEIRTTSGGGYEHLALFNISENRQMEINLTSLTPDSTDDLSEEFLGFSAPAISPDERLAAAGSNDNRIFVWDSATGNLRYELKGHAASVTAVAFQPGGQILASASEDGTVRLWNTDQGSLRKVITGFKNGLRDLEFKDSQRLLVQPAGLPPQLVDINTGSIKATSISYPAPHPLVLERYRAGFARSDHGDVKAVFRPDGKKLAMLSDIVQILDIPSGQVTTVITGGEGEKVASAVFSPDGNQVAVIFESRSIKIWNATTGALIRQLRQADGLREAYSYSGSLAFSPNGQYLAASDEFGIEVYDVRTAQQLFSFPAERKDGIIEKIAFSDDSRQLYALSKGDRALQVWDVTGGKQVHREEIPNGYENWSTQRTSDWHWPLFARFCDDLDGARIEIRNATTGEAMKIPSPDYGGVLRFSPDGSLLMGIFDDQRLYVWKTRTGDLAYIGDLSDYVSYFDISPDSGFLAISREGRVQLWDLQPALKAMRASGSTPVPLPTEEYNSANTYQPTPGPTLVLKPIATPILPQDAIAPQNAAQVAEVARFGDGTITWAGWSRDGQQILIAGSLGVSGYDTANLSASAALRVPVGQLDPNLKLSSLAQDSQGSILAVGTSQGQVEVWNVSSRKMLLNQPGEGNPALSPDGKLLVYQHDSGAWVYDIQSQKTIAEIIAPVGSPVFSPDSRWIAADNYGWQARILDARTGIIANALYADENRLESLTFSPGGQYLAAVSGQQVYIWGNMPGAEPHRYPDQPQQPPSSEEMLTPTTLCFSPDGQRLAVATHDGLITIIDRETGKTLQTVGNEAGAVQLLSFHPSGKRLLSVMKNGQVSVWDLNSAAPVQHVIPAYHSSPLKGLVLKEQNSALAWGDNVVWAYPLNGGSPGPRSVIPTGTIFTVSPGRNYAAVYSNKRMEIWRLPSPARLMILEGQPVPVSYSYWLGYEDFYDAVFAPDESMLGVTGTGGIWIYKTSNFSLVNQLEGEYISWMAFRPDNQVLVRNFDAFYGGTAVQSIHPGPTFQKQGSGDPYIALNGTFQRDINGKGLFSPDGQQVVQITYRLRSTLPDELGIWNAADGALVKKIDLIQDARIVSLALDPSGKLAAAGMDDGRILLVDLSTGRILATLRGHAGKVSAIAFSRDGRSLASAGEDAIVVIWGVR